MSSFWKKVTGLLGAAEPPTDGAPADAPPGTPPPEPAALLSSYQDASKRHRAGALEEARGMYQAILEQEPAHPGAHTSLGVLHLQRGELTEARRYLERARELRPENIPTIGTLGNVFQELGLHAQAILCYEKVLALQPDNAGAHNNLGNVNKDMGHYDRAADSYRRALSIDPNQPHAHYNLADALAAQGDLAEAAHHASMAVGVPEAAALAALLLRRLGRHDEAVSAYDRALALRPSAELHNGRGMSLRQLGHVPRAMDAYREAIRLEPGYPEALNNLGNVLRDLARDEEAIDAFQRAIDASDRPEFRVNLGNLLMSVDRPGDAAEQYRTALLSRPAHALTLYNLGIALQESGAIDEAVAALEESTSLDAEQAPAWVKLGGALLEAGRWGHALAAYERSTRLLQDHGESLIGPYEVSGVRLRQEARQLALLRERERLPTEFSAYAELVAELAEQIGGANALTLHGESLQRLSAGWCRMIHHPEAPALGEGVLIAELDAASVTGAYEAGEPGVLSAEGLLKPEALAALATFCEEATIWRIEHTDGCLGARLREGLASPLLLQIAEALQAGLPDIVDDRCLVDCHAFLPAEGHTDDRHEALQGSDDDLLITLRVPAAPPVVLSFLFD